jgi:hypothetical protein
MEPSAASLPSEELNRVRLWLYERFRRNVRWTPETGQLAKRESSLGTAVWPRVRHDQYAEETWA